MTSYRPIDSKREEFRKYLERAGVMDALTKALVSLYEEADKPEDALDYVRKRLGDERPDLSEFQALQAEAEELRAKNESLELELSTFRPLPEEGEAVDGEAPAEGDAPADGDADEPPPEA